MKRHKIREIICFSNSFNYLCSKLQNMTVMEVELKTIPLVLMEVSRIQHNTGQIKDVPKNPRLIKDYRYKLMKKSIEESPEMLSLREIIVYPLGESFVAICGNQRLRACRELGFKEVPVKVLPVDTPPEKLREYANKDNVSLGENDVESMRHEWNIEELMGWGVELPEEKKKDAFEQRFNAIKDEDAVYPMIPKYDEKHELFIIHSTNEVDSNWLREKLGMQRMKSYKSGKLSKSNVISIEDVRHALEDSHSKS